MVEGMYKIAIVEDEHAAASFLRECLNRYASSREISVEITCFENATAYLKTQNAQFHIVFMDIKMQGINGMEAAKQLRKTDHEAVLIFVTTMASFAIHGYEVDAMDFILKPVSYPRLQSTMDKALRRVARSRNDEVILQTTVGIRRMSASKIQFIEVIDHRLVYHTDEGELEAWNSMKNAEQELAQRSFLRCNNSVLVNLGRVSAVRDNDVYVGQRSFSISRGRKKAFMEALMAYLGG